MITKSNLFAKEEALSNSTYPEAYKIKGLMEQIDILGNFFPNISQLRDEQWGLLYKTLPPNAEGWFVLPRWQKIAATHGESVAKVLGMLASERRFQNIFGDKFGEKNLRRNPKTAKLLQRLAEQQDPPFGGDMVVVPCQFGLRHRGRSVRRSRAVFSDNEFGLGAFEVACMLLAHPDRVVQWRQLHIDCPGDEFSPEGNGEFSDAGVFCFHEENLEFDADWSGRALAHYGSASGFIS